MSAGEFHDYAQGGQTYEGYISRPKGASKGVVVVAHAWGGQGDFERGKADWLAGLGYTGFALDVYGKGKRGASVEECQALMTPLVENPDELRSRLAHGLEAAKKASGQSKAAGIGFCFGGLCMFMMARANMAIEGVASFHGLFGKPSDNPAPIKPKILALHGWDDPMAPPADVLAFAKEMTAAKADWQLHAYGGTLHAFTNPEANDPSFGTQFKAEANRRSFAACEDFLKEVLG